MDIKDEFQQLNGTSNLSSLFGQSPTPAMKSSLTYIAPKETNAVKSLSNQNDKLNLIVMKQVFLYQCQNYKYTPVGVVGLSIIGSRPNKAYHILLYKTRDNVICKFKINKLFSFSLNENNYASFVGNGTDFVVKFESSDDLCDFATVLAEVKSDISAANEIICQDLQYSSEDKVSIGDRVTIRTSLYAVTNAGRDLIQKDNSTTLIYDEQIGERWPWILACWGINYNAKRAIIAPISSSEPWKNLISTEKMLLHIEFLKETGNPMLSSIPSSSENRSTNDNDDNEPLMESEAEICKKHKIPKSSLVSRMARLGQPAFRAAQSVHTDSDSDVSISPPCFRPKSRIKSPGVVDKEVIPAENKPELIVPQQLTMSSKFPTTEHFLRKELCTPCDNNLAMHFAETRSCNSEIRMSLAKITDKLEQIVTHNHLLPLVDPDGLLHSLQRLIQENSNLKKHVESQNLKIETLNDRIYNLTQKSVGTNIINDQCNDKSFISNEKQKLQDQELSSCKQIILSLQSEKMDLAASLETKSTNLNNLTEECKSARAALDISSKELAELQDFKRTALITIEEHKTENNRLESQLINRVTDLDEKNYSNHDIKGLMNKLYKILQSEFSQKPQYDGAVITKVLMNVIRDFTLEFIDHKQISVDDTDSNIKNVETIKPTGLNSILSPESKPFYPASIISASNQIVMLLSILSVIPYYSNNIDLLCACIAPTVHTSQIIAKTIHFKIHRLAFLDYLSRLENVFEDNFLEINVCNNFGKYFEKKSRSVRMYHMAHLIGQIVGTTIFFTPIVYQLFTFHVENINLPILGVIPWNTKNITGFLLAFFLQCLAFYFFNTKMVAFDYFIMDIIVLHYSKIMFFDKILEGIISHYQKNGLTLEGNQALKIYIECHKRMLSCNSSLKSLLSGYLIIEYLYVFIHTCIPAFVITSTQSWTFLQKTALVIMVSSALLALFLLAKCGSTLSAAGDLLSRRMYGLWLLSWPGMQLAYQMNGYFNHKPFQLRFLSLFPLCFPTFVAISRLILTYYMALNEVQSLKSN